MSGVVFSASLKKRSKGRVVCGKGKNPHTTFCFLHTTTTEEGDEL